MAELNLKPLADLLFGSTQPEPCKPEEELAKVISAWFRAQQARLHDLASFGTPSAASLKPPHQQL